MLGARIAALRRSAGWSQTELARRLQLSASAVGMYEQGRREPSMDILSAMAQAFGVSLDFLITGTDQDSGGDPTARLLAEQIRAAEQAMQRRKKRPFSREELAVLLAAMLMED